jgi:hypothetical protein
MSLKERKVEQINNAVGDVINQLAVKGRKRLIGSNSLRAMIYGADYDAEAYPKQDRCSAVARLIKEAYFKTKKNPDVWITDFKSGWDDRLVYRGDFSKHSIEEYLENPLIPAAYKKKIMAASGDDQEKLVNDLWKLRWDAAAMRRGSVNLIDGTKKYFKDAIMDMTPTKIDLIIKVGNQFAEVSENYYITCDGKKNWNTSPNQEEKEAEFEDEIRYYTKVNKFKALKRLFSLLKYEGEEKNKAKLDRLVEFFNSQVGYANKIKNELDVLESVLEQPRKPKWEDVAANIQFIKEQFSHLYKVDITQSTFKYLDGITAKTALPKIKKLRDYLVDVVNRHSTAFLAEMMK